MKKNNPLLRKNLFRLILLIYTGIVPFSLSAQTTEHFTGEVDGGTTFSEGGGSFSLTGAYLKVENYPGFGWTGSANDDFYVDNIDMTMSSAGVIGSIKNVTKNFYVQEMYLAPGDASLIIGKYGDVIIRGKLGGITQFTYTLLSANINNNSPVIINNSYTYVSLSSYNTILINELEFEVTGGLRYLAIDAFKFTIPLPNSAPTDISLSASAINENVTANSPVGTLSSTDPDAGNTFTYTLVAGSGSADNASFTISGSNLLINSSPNYESKSSYSIRVRTTDQGSLYYEKAMIITINDLNETPTDIALSAIAINENVVANSTVGTLSSTDPDASSSFSYTLVAGTGSTDNASFNINGNSLRITNSPDFETKSSYSVRVRTTDQGNILFFEKAFTITINNVNETPIDIALSTSAINENVVANSTVGTLSSTDPDASSSFSYTLVAGTGSTDNASFNINGNSLRITNSPDFETKSSYSVRVRTTDQGNILFFEKAFTITINNVNETPIDIALSTSAINENVVANSTVGTLSSTDPDASSSFSYTLVAGTGSTDNASFNISGSSLRITNSPDYETKSSYSVRVRTTDQGNILFFEKAFTITINNVNETPIDIALSTSAINENVVANSTVGTLSSTDPDASSSFSYTLVAGTGSTDNASFNISGNSLRITNSPDFETKSSYSVRVRTTDQSNILFFEKAFTIIINNVNETPIDIALSTSAINENVVANSTVGTLSSTDPDASSSFSYTLVAGTGSTDNASFNISGSSLRITNSPDYETKSSYSVRVRTTDQGNILFFEKTFTITINDLNEPVVVTTQAVSGISSTTATCYGNITDLGSPNPTAYGVCWNTSGSPITSDSKVDKGAVSATGAFTAAISGLTPNTKYYVRAFATNSSGTLYGGEVNFTTVPATASTYSGLGNWSNPSNWSNGIPGSLTSVTIDGDVTLAGSTAVKTITLNGGSSLIVATGQTLTVPNGIYNNGLITNNGTIDGAIVVPIVFEENGGTLVSDLLQDYNTALTLPSTTKNGYNFIGWYSDIALNTVFSETTMPINGLTLYAKWQLATALNEVESDALTFYPNPAINTITVNAGNKRVHLVVYSLAGELLMSEEVVGSAVVDISSLPKGTYLVKLNGETTKLIKM